MNEWMKHHAYRIGTSLLCWVRVVAKPWWKEEEKCPAIASRFRLESILCAFQKEATCGSVRFLVGIFPLTTSETHTSPLFLKGSIIRASPDSLTPAVSLNLLTSGLTSLQSTWQWRSREPRDSGSKQTNKHRTQGHTRSAQAPAGATVRVRHFPTHSRGLAPHPSLSHAAVSERLIFTHPLNKRLIFPESPNSERFTLSVKLTSASVLAFH